MKVMVGGGGRKKGDLKFRKIEHFHESHPACSLGPQ